VNNPPDRLIEVYLQRLLELRQSQPLQQTDLEALALELGMTAEDLEVARQQAQDHLTRGQGYGQFQRWDEAIEELTQAVALNPIDPEMLQGLAAAYQARYQQRRQAADKTAAIALAKQCLALQPNDMAAIELISRLDQPRSQIFQPALVGGRRYWHSGSIVGIAAGYPVADARRRVPTGRRPDHCSQSSGGGTGRRSDHAHRWYPASRCIAGKRYPGGI
jgi:tetratricopeptide (TPR) repeat protein